MKIIAKCILPAAIILQLTVQISPAWAGAFERRWIFTSETSAVIYWQLGEISSSATSYVEYGKTESLSQGTEITRRPRWSHLHHLKELDLESTYYYRMVAIDTLTNLRSESEILQFTLQPRPDAVRIPRDVSGPPYVLDQPNIYYILTEDVTADGNAFQIAADGVTLDLDGHTVTFGDNTSSQVFGVRFINQGKGTLCNGHIVQGKLSGDYSCAIRSNSRPYPTEISGIATDVHLKCAYPVNFHSQASDVRIHHNHFYSRVTEIESRHYPGNALLRMYISGGNIQIHDNLLTEGCHRAIHLADGGSGVEVSHNDIRHHQQYVNGYALIPCRQAKFHHNKVTSTGRGAHLSKEGIIFHDNYLDLKGHQHLSDLPANTRPFHHRLIELHGIKFEGNNSRNCKAYNNFVRIIQKLPHDSDGQGEPEDKIDNGVYLRSTATSLDASYLVDDAQNWETDRWRYYYVRYSDDLPSTRIATNSHNSLLARYEGASPSKYTIYMKWQYVPPTPLNIACYDPNAMNEVYNNTFIALTEYSDIWHGGYGNTGNWASTIMFVSMDKGPASSGKYSAYVHDNQFVSNDLFLNGYEEVNMTMLIKDNTFTLVKTPLLTERNSRFRAIGATLEDSIKAGNNVFYLNPDQPNPDINGDRRVSVVDVVALILLGRSEPGNPVLDWNADGRFGMDDVIVLLKNIFSMNKAVLLSS
ncbi:MAG: right-handed parallel beta-helix repeat-containing protein, partial [Gemmatimonadota bacterium]|nr:right-handed parallel beta-helix repeat-containing protein [Gemmatimonadota bacterium]